MKTLKSASNIIDGLNFNEQPKEPQKIIIPPQAINIVNQLFNDLKGICTAWKNTFTDAAIEQSAKQQWVQALIENNIVNQRQIDLGMKKARKLANPWFPSSGQFISWCKPSLEDFGLMPAEQALRAVINGKKRSHPVLFLAAQATGSRELKTLHHSDLLKVFTRNYEIVCQRFINGENLELEIPKALPEQVHVATEQSQVKLNAARLRNLLKKGAA